MSFGPDTLSGRVYVVSGAASGMGAAHARAIAAAGGRVVLGDIDIAGARRVADEIGSAAMATELDVTEPDSWLHTADHASRLGPVGGLVNNAGIFGAGSTSDADIDNFRRVQAVNVEGTLHGIRALTPALRDAGGGSIVNISSIAGLLGIQDRVAYVTSKWAVRGLTRAAALDLGGWGIRVNSVHPGRIATGFIADLDSPILPNQIIREPGQPEDISALVLFLLSDDSRFSTGSEFIADGGRYVGEYRR